MGVEEKCWREDGREEENVGAVSNGKRFREDLKKRDTKINTGFMQAGCPR